MNTASTAFTGYNNASCLTFFGLEHAPFPMAPDDSDFFFSNDTEKILKRVCKAVLSRRGFILLTGDVGLGKTTLTRRVVSQLEQNRVETSLILHSFYQEHDLLKAINRDFGLVVDDDCITSQMEALNQFLLEKYSRGVNCAIIIDDAQGLSIRSLELVRMLSNLEADQEKLVQILLVGQTELAQTMHLHEMRQLKSRVSLWEVPRALDRKDLENYVRFKLNKAGDGGRIKIEKAAVNRLYKLSRGNFRRVNVIMDNALQNAFDASSMTIKKQFVKDVLTPADTSAGNFPAGPVLLVLSIIALGWMAGSFLFYRTAVLPGRDIGIASLFPVGSSRSTTAAPAVLVPERALAKKMPADKMPAEKAVPFEASGEDAVAEITPAKIVSGPDSQPVPAADAARTPEEPVPEPSADVAVDKSDPLIRFLSFYGLESARQPLFEFLHGGMDLEEAREAIFNATGYQLIRLKSLEGDLHKKYSVLAVPTDATPGKNYYLFWKPALCLDRFFLYMQDREIEKLQHMLQESGLYAYETDGVVDPELVESLQRFQKNYHLGETGYPSPETLFLLTHLSKAGA